MNLISKLWIVTEAELPVMVHGDPGIGKTSVAYQLGIALNEYTKTIIASLYESEAFTGVPHVLDRSVVYSDPELFKEFKDLDSGIIFLDELNTCSRKIQNLLLRVVLERVAGPLVLSPKIRMIAAGNHTNVAGNIQMSLALSNRFVHIFQTADADTWSSGILTGFTTPKLPEIDPDWKIKYIPYYTSLVSGYIKANPSALMAMPDNVDEDPKSQAWSSPRTWEYAIKLLAITHHLDYTDRVELINGTIGVSATRLLMDFIKKNNLINIDEIDIDDIQIPNSPDVADILLRSIVYHAKDPKYSELALRVFEKAKATGYGSLVMTNAKALAQQLVKHIPSTEIIQRMPYISDVLKKI